MSVLFIFVMIESCGSKIYPDERLAIAPDFLTLLNFVLEEDTILFENSTGRNKSFAITEVDSIISNQKGWFMNQAPYKLIRARFREIGMDTVHLERENEMFVNKNPATNISSIGIQFNNFYFNDTILPALHFDTLILNNRRLTNYYLFETSLGLRNSNDVKILYINVTKGFLGFKTLSGEVWINEKE